MIEPFARGFPARFKRLFQTIRRPHVLALMPVLVLSAFLLGGQPAMVFVALAFPVALAVALPPDPTAEQTAIDPLTGLAQREGILAALDRALRHSARVGGSPAP